MNSLPAAPVVSRGAPAASVPGVPDPSDLLDHLPDDLPDSLDDIPGTPGWIEKKITGSIAEKVMTAVVYGSAYALCVALIGIGAWRVVSPPE